MLCLLRRGNHLRFLVGLRSVLGCAVVGSLLPWQCDWICLVIGWLVFLVCCLIVCVCCWIYFGLGGLPLRLRLRAGLICGLV